ncbi:MAG: lipopolysaccharide transport periplasmic protein LptA [Lysobacterales bacterium]|jgi:lipopolysaccharide export system protein LptA
MKLNRNIFFVQLCLCLSLLVAGVPSLALQSDREKPLEVYADNTDGFLGDGITTLRGKVDIRQGSLHITADEAEVDKADGKVKSVTLHGKPAYLEQEIEDQGRVTATANRIDYQVATGLVTLTGNADVVHPQYRISGDVLTYDLNIQHFEGTSDNNPDGRVRIQLDPELIQKKDKKTEKPGKSGIPDAPPKDAAKRAGDEDGH